MSEQAQPADEALQAHTNSERVIALLQNLGPDQKREFWSLLHLPSDERTLDESMIGDADPDMAELFREEAEERKASLAQWQEEERVRKELVIQLRDISYGRLRSYSQPRLREETKYWRDRPDHFRVADFKGELGSKTVTFRLVAKIKEDGLEEDRLAIELDEAPSPYTSNHNNRHMRAKLNNMSGYGKKTLVKIGEVLEFNRGEDYISSYRQDVVDADHNTPSVFPQQGAKDSTELELPAMVDLADVSDWDVNADELNHLIELVRTARPADPPLAPEAAQD